MDWHDFVVVEVIPFADNDNTDLPPPVNVCAVPGLHPRAVVLCFTGAFSWVTFD